MATGNTNWDSDDDDEPDDDATQQGQDDKSAKGLRSHARKVDKENQELKVKLAEFEAAARKERVAKAVTAEGYDPLVAGLVPDSVASDDAALKKWLSDNEKLLVKVKQEEKQEGTVQAEEVELGEETDAWDRMSKVSASALPASKQADTASAIKNAKTREELSEVLRGMGNSFVG